MAICGRLPSSMPIGSNRDYFYISRSETRPRLADHRIVKKGHRAPAVEPTAGLPRVDDHNAPLPPDLGLVRVSEDQDIICLIGEKRPRNASSSRPSCRRHAFSSALPSCLKVTLDRGIHVGNQEPQPVMLENEGGCNDIAHPLDGFDKARLLSVAIPENAFYRAGQVPELPCRERGDEVAGVDDQATFRVIEKPDRAPESDQVVMGVRKDADHEGIIEELDKLDK